MYTGGAVHLMQGPEHLASRQGSRVRYIDRDAQEQQGSLHLSVTAINNITLPNNRYRTGTGTRHNPT